MTNEADRKVEARNKEIVLAMWRALIDEHDFSAAPKYIVEDYIQRSPSAGQGRAAVIEHFTKMWGPDPLPKDKVKYTKFDMVIAEGDLVQLMFKRVRPDPNDASKTIDTWWYDTYRLKDGMIVEHWDSALK
jgi:predicted SnoaL-like aldol condensation-catalyzing enzyme